MAPREAPEAALPGLSEAPAAFTHALFAPGGPSPRSRVALLSAWRNGACPPPDVVARLLGAEVTRLDSAAGAANAEGEGFDLVMIDGAGTRGDLAQGGQVLAQIAKLQGRLRARNTAILVLLPASAVETAALALDLGASDVVAGAVSPREIVLRARALIARNRLREALRDQVRRGLRAAMTDPLTGLHNRRYAEACLRRLAEEARESRRGLALVMIDIDHFKSINDTHGHAAGDRVLVEAALRLRAVLRPTDLLARVGGEEFLVALPDAGPEEAGLIAERLRRAIGRQPFALEDPAPSPHSPEREPPSALLPRLRPASIPPEREGEGAVRVTVSIGVAAASAERLGARLELAELLPAAPIKPSTRPRAAGATPWPPRPSPPDRTAALRGLVPTPVIRSP